MRKNSLVCLAMTLLAVLMGWASAGIGGHWSGGPDTETAALWAETGYVAGLEAVLAALIHESTTARAAVLMARGGGEGDASPKNGKNGKNGNGNGNSKNGNGDENGEDEEKNGDEGGEQEEAEPERLWDAVMYG